MQLNEFMQRLEELTVGASQIDKGLFETYNVKRGLRNQDGSGVLVGLTNIGDVIGYEKKDGLVIPVEGKLFYRGINVEDLVHGFQTDKRHGFDETVYLLLTGKLPNKTDLDIFSSYLAGHRDLPNSFVNLILSFRGKNIMNMLARSILAMYTQDDEAENYSHVNLLKQSLEFHSQVSCNSRLCLFWIPPYLSEKIVDLPASGSIAQHGGKFSVHAQRREL